MHYDPKVYLIRVALVLALVFAIAFVIRVQFP